MFISALQMGVYLLLLVGTVLYLIFCWAFDRHLDRWHHGVALGLLASPFGFGLPYGIASGIGWLFYGGRSLLPVADWPALLRVPFVVLIVLGPVAGPPIAVWLVAAWYVHRRRA